jgi:exopolysaccharide production protein ExoZ
MSKTVASQSGAQSGVLRNIQALRALAAYLVVVYHARLLTPIGDRMSFDFGNAGVDIFFLISGFIIAHVSRRDDAGRPGGFLLKRLIRIVPLYWMLTLALFVVAQKAPSLAGAGGQPDLAMLLKSLLFAPYLDGSGAMHPVLFMGWTLDYEMFFYVVFAAALLARREIVRLLLVTAVLLGLVAAGLALRPQGPVAQTYTDPLMIEFVAGMWLSLALRAMPKTLPPAAVALLLTLSAAALAALALGDIHWPGLPREIKWGLPALVLVASVLALQSAGVTIRSRGLLLLGEASYAIYLTHPFLIKIVTLAYQKLHVGGLAVQAAALLGLYVLVGVVGVAVHLIVERPLIHWLRRRFLPRAPASVAEGEPIPRA